MVVLLLYYREVSLRRVKSFAHAAQLEGVRAGFEVLLLPESRVFLPFQGCPLDSLKGLFLDVFLAGLGALVSASGILSGCGHIPEPRSRRCSGSGNQNLESSFKWTCQLAPPFS